MKNHWELPLVVILGPTASGKSALAICLARRLGGEVVACDSTQLYRGFDIGTAKPNVDERQGIAHHLIDVLEVSEEVTAGGYCARAKEVLESLRARKCLPILTVGTGLYFRALLEGLADLPRRSEPLRERLRASAAAHSRGHLRQMLARLDPHSAAKIATADEQKLIRAIEVCLLAKKPLSELYGSGRKPLEGWRAIKIGLRPEREALYERVRARTKGMLERGWLEEVRVGLERGLPASAKPFDFIGYRELRAVVNQEMSLEQARLAIEQATQRYAKRQMTWFRREADVHWLAGFGNDPQIQKQALAWLGPEMCREVPGAQGKDV
jgi:tRNA dimethylallyltransferase